MTPRINETTFSETLLAQLKLKKSAHQMDGKGSITQLTHPAILKIQQQFTESPNELNLSLKSGDYHILTFKNKAEAQKNYPQIQNFDGFPWHLGQFRAQSPDEALIHFGDLGSVLLSKLESFSPYLVPELHHYTLPVWLDYALSPELWGPAGKWMRFHERLNTLFEDNGLLIEKPFPGYYPLKKEAQWLETHGFHGLQTNDQFVLIFTWDFPLSGLVELEKILARGP